MPQSKKLCFIFTWGVLVELPRPSALRKRLMHFRFEIIIWDTKVFWMSSAIQSWQNHGLTLYVYFVIVTSDLKKRGFVCRPMKYPEVRISWAAPRGDCDSISLVLHLGARGREVAGYLILTPPRPFSVIVFLCLFTNMPDFPQYSIVERNTGRRWVVSLRIR
jgi:hypothetical protein